MHDSNQESQPRQFPSRRNLSRHEPVAEANLAGQQEQTATSEAAKGQPVDLLSATPELTKTTEVPMLSAHPKIPSRRAQNREKPGNQSSLDRRKAKQKSRKLPLHFPSFSSKWSRIIALIVTLALLLLIIGVIWLWAGTRAVVVTETDPFTVTGRHGATLTLQVDREITAKENGAQVIESGRGREITPGEPVFTRVTNFAAASGEPKNLQPIERIGLANEQLLPGLLYTSVVGKHEGDRIAVVHNIGQDESPEFEISIIDIMYTQAHGELAPAPENLTIWVDGTAEIPQITKVDSLDLSKSISQVVITGTGAQVGPSDTLLVQYTVMNAQTGEITNSTWSGDKTPKKVQMSELMKPLSNELTDQKVGSRLVVLVPAAEADGNIPVIIMIDILGIISTK
ncbi:hypothetical protein [Boudabousia marimammalium]|uniref:Peptidylprolyl isomerase n=1 Tax=Boudabousia marimammalium TaxID=156892 RepID=A0A1Q5PRI6_9ACTO|nr:hypothetical protein [Boudabousia marimammalium]OKL50040.1 hypothetical protein BM477_03905 [Boudabousia marimammalium]